MMHKIILSVAPVAANTPVDAAALALDIEKSANFGASMCHLHCRQKNGALTSDITYMSQCFDQILKKTDIIVQASTGGVSDMTIAERCYPLDYPRTESTSLNGGTTNLGEAVYRNSLDDIRYCSKIAYDKGILPEIEVFDIGMIHTMERITVEIPFRAPLLFNLVFGHQGGMQPTIESLFAFRSFVPKGALWGVTHFGRTNWNFLAAAVAMGASLVRIGFEDSRYLAPDIEATENWQLVEKLAALLRAMDYQPATAAEARKILQLN